jgi:beta-lactamase regulating signal transducer with metallopeptidase domain
MIMLEISNCLESSFQSVLWLSWQGTLFAFVVAVGLLFTGRWLPARWRYLAWSLVLLRLLVFCGTLSSPLSLYNLSITGITAQRTQESTGATTVQEAEEQYSSGVGVAETSPTASPTSIYRPAIDHIADTGRTDSLKTPASTFPRPPSKASPILHLVKTEWAIKRFPDGTNHNEILWAVLAIVWVAGVYVAAMRLVLQELRTRRILASADQAPHEVRQLAAELSRQAGLGRCLEVRVLQMNFGPAVSGLFRPVLYLPPWMSASLSRDQLSLVIRHEMAHLMRWDLLMLWITVFARIVHWFNPGVRWALSNLQRECELACDEHVLKELDNTERRAYGNVLLQVVERATQPTPAPMLPAFSQSAQHLKRRVEMIGKFRKRPYRTNLLGVLVLGALAIVGLTDGLADGRTSGTPPTTTSGNSNSHQRLSNAPAAAIQSAPKSIREASATPSSATDGDIVLTGVCTDENGASVSSARLSIYGQSNPVATVRLVASTSTDGAGRYRIEMARRELSPEMGTGRAMLSITSDRHVSHQVPLDIEETMHEVEIQMKTRGIPLKGRVTDEGGEPRPGVWVFFSNTVGQPIPNALSALTDEDGRFLIRDSEHPTNDNNNGYTLLAMHPGYPVTLTHVTSTARHVAMQLAKGGTVDGQVVDDVTGRPAAQCIVSAQGVDDGGWYQTQTDAEGRFRLFVVQDRYNIWAAADDRMPIALDRVEVRNGQQRSIHAIRLAKGGFVTGRVVDADSRQPIPEDRLSHYPIRVAHHGPARPRSGAAVTSAPVGKNGRYRLHVAPGDNYVHLVSPELDIRGRSHDPNQDGVIPVRDGETVQLDFFIKVKDPVARAGDRASAAAKPRNRTDGHERATEPPRDWPDTKFGRLMLELEVLQNQRRFGQLDWERTMRELILLGPGAVPELIAALDATPSDDRLMLRSIPFIMRGIGDKRTIPALIRAIPRCGGDGGSDIAYRCEDPELLKFLQTHDNNERDDRSCYSYGRPINEVFRTLERWTGVSHGWKQLAFVWHRNKGTPRQRQLQQALFNNNAQRWAHWWEEHWQEHVADSQWADVRLPDFDRELPVEYHLDHNKPLKHGPGRSQIAESVYAVKSGRTFYDLDTRRECGLPETWRGRSRDELEAVQDDIIAWARTEGFDVMGTEIDHQNRRHYALAAIDLEAWEIPMAFWLSESRLHSMLERSEQPMGEVSAQFMIDSGRPIENLLAHFDSDKQVYNHDQIATFFCITSEGTPGLLYLGVEVKDTNVIPGPLMGDDELNPKGYRKGRRFCFTGLVESE